MTPLIQNTIPVLASLAIAETVHFYGDRLGFSTSVQRDDYAVLSRDGAEIHFAYCKDRHIAENTSCYIRTDDIQALYEEFSAKGVYVEPPVERDWGMKELYVHDPHGNLLKFGQSIS